MNDQSPKGQDQIASDKLERMAARVQTNFGNAFGGVVVIVPPAGPQGGFGGDAIELLMLDESGNPAQFWSTLKTRIDMTLSELQEKERQLTGFGRR